jgi:hypothetical protein
LFALGRAALLLLLELLLAQGGRRPVACRGLLILPQLEAQAHQTQDEHGDRDARRNLGLPG